MRSLSKGLRAALFATALLTSSAAASGGFLGVQVNDAANGVRILSVRDGSPAAQAGLAADDLVAAVGDTTIGSADDLISALSNRSPGDQIALKVKRAGGDHTINVTLGQAPAEGVVAAPAPVAPVAAEPKAFPAIPLVPMPAESVPDAAPATAAAPSPTAAIASDEAPRRGGFLGVTLGGEGGDNTVAGVVDGSPAAKAGLKGGDQIVAVDGKETANAEAISKVLATKQPGDGVEITVMRDGKRKLRTATLAEYGAIDFAATGGLTAPATISLGDGVTSAKVRLHPADGGDEKSAKPASGGRGWLGVYLNTDADGVAVDNVVEGGPAEGAGLKAGDRIVKVGGKDVKSTEDLLGALEGKAGDDIKIVVMRGDSEKRLGVTLGTPPADVAVGGMEPPPPMPDKNAATEKVAKAVKNAKQAEAKAKSAAKQAERSAKGDMDKAKAAEKIAKAKAETVEKRAATQAKAATEKTKVKARVATTTQRWFFPEGTQLSLRIEEKDGGFWITSGNGSQGIHVPADGSTKVTLEGKGDGVEVRTSNEGGMEPKVFSLSAAGDGDVRMLELDADEADDIVVSVMGEGDHEPRIISRRRMTDAEGDNAKDGAFTFSMKSDSAEPHVLQWHGSTTDGGNDFYVHGQGHGEWKSDVNVEKDEVHVVPHSPMHGGGIHITNNGGTVIIGDSVARAFLGGDHKKVGLLMKDGAGHDEKLAVLKELGYVGHDKVEKKAEKKGEKKDMKNVEKKGEKKKEKGTD